MTFFFNLKFKLDELPFTIITKFKEDCLDPLYLDVKFMPGIDKLLIFHSVLLIKKNL